MIVLKNPNTKRLASKPLIWLIGFFGFMNIYPIQAVLPQVMQDFHSTPGSTGLTVGIAILGMALVSPFMGMLSDALGRKLILCCSLLVVTVPTLLIATAGSLSAVMVLRFVQGLAIPGFQVATIAYLAEEFPQSTVPGMTTVYVGGGIMGGFFGRFFTGYAADYLGWRGAFEALALLNCAGALLVWWRLPVSRAFSPNRDMHGAFQTFGRHLRNRRLIATCAVAFCVMFSMVGTFTYVSFHLAVEPFHLSARGLANVFLVYLVGTVVTPISARFIARHGLLKSLLCALATAVIGVMLTLWSHLVAVIAGLVICSCSVFVCQSIAMTSIGECVTEGRSLAMGIFNTLYYSGGALATLLVGLIYEWQEWTGAVFLIAAVQITAGAIAYVSWHKQPRYL